MLDLNNIKTIIFDFGGVIININPQKTINALHHLGILHAEKLMSENGNQSMLQRYELGLISDNEFINYIKQHCTPDTHPVDIIQAWNAMLLDIPMSRIVLLNHLSEEYNLLLLSNTNHLHYLSYSKNFERTTKGKKWNDVFKHCYFSFEIHKRKPSIDIYKHVLQKEMIKPEETFFIDDSLENIETAMMLGIKTHWLQGELTDLFKKSTV